ncbi:hypothetical protein H6A65_14350 [Mediterraneibacter glycyrrhizinilyticus]|nr:hypothetical protein [Mediterraneibacter glycyrrhizinilyticus]
MELMHRLPHTPGNIPLGIHIIKFFKQLEMEELENSVRISMKNVFAA